MELSVHYPKSFFFFALGKEKELTELWDNLGDAKFSFKKFRVQDNCFE